VLVDHRPVAAIGLIEGAPIVWRLKRSNDQRIENMSVQVVFAGHRHREFWLEYLIDASRHATDRDKNKRTTPVASPTGQVIFNASFTPNTVDG
jgi:hypothetical protein